MNLAFRITTLIGVSTFGYVLILHSAVSRAISLATYGAWVAFWTAVMLIPEMDR